jgi:hypothetical protein
VILTIFLPALYTYKGLPHQSGLVVTLWHPVLHGGMTMALADLLERRDVSEFMREGILGPTPLFVGLGLLGAVRQRGRRWLAPALWIAAAAALSVGPWLDLPLGVPLPGPFSLLADVPVLRRLWWPDRALFLAVPAAALLAAGGAVAVGCWLPSRARPAAGPVAAALLGLEALLALPNLPMPATPGTASSHALALADGTGPVFILPMAERPFQFGRNLLLDQVFHGRPLVNGMMPPGSSTAPPYYYAMFERPVLKYLHSCAGAPGSVPAPDAEEGRKFLRAMGLSAVHVDMDAFDGEDAAEAPTAYVDCAEAVLGTSWTQVGPYRVYPVEE